jgi:transcriptional regulator with XRE-family HTH domain
LSKTLGSKRHAALVEFIAAKREAAGLTQFAFAKRLGENQSFVSRLESGQRRIDVVQLLKIAELLKFDPARLMSDLRKLPD